MEMSGRERLMAVFQGKETDRIPWSPLVDEYFIESLPEMGLPAMSTIEFGKSAGYDIMERHVNPFIWNHHSNVNLTIKEKGNEKCTTIDTPIGSISTIFKHSKLGGGIIKYPVTTRNDMKVYQVFLENSIVDRDYERFIEVDSLIGDDGLATASIYESGISNLISRMTGLENMVYFQYDYPEDFNELVWTFHEFNKKILKVICESPAELIFCYEGTSTTTISRNMYLNHSLPQTNEYADIVHRYGKIFITHMCGKLKGFRDLIASGRQDGIDSLCPPTTGDVKLCEALEFFPGKIIIGGIEPPSLQRMSVKEIEEYVRSILDECSHDRFILSTGDALPYATPVQNLQKVLETVKKYRSQST